MGLVARPHVGEVQGVWAGGVPDQRKLRRERATEVPNSLGDHSDSSIACE